MYVVYVQLCVRACTFIAAASARSKDLVVVAFKESTLVKNIANNVWKSSIDALRNNNYDAKYLFEDY